MCLWVFIIIFVKYTGAFVGIKELIITTCYFVDVLYYLQAPLSLFYYRLQLELYMMRKRTSLMEANCMLKLSHILFNLFMFYHLKTSRHAITVDI